MRLIFRPQAQADLLGARAWYDDRAPGLGLEFARAVDARERQRHAKRLRDCRVEGDFHHVITRRFPYSIIYRMAEDELVVVSCFHHRRRPGGWARKRRI